MLEDKNVESSPMMETWFGKFQGEDLTGHSSEESVMSGQLDLKNQLCLARDQKH